MSEGIMKYQPLWGKWEVGEQIGRGISGIVYELRRLQDNMQVDAVAKYVSIPSEDVWMKYKHYSDVEQEEYFAKLVDVYQKMVSNMMRLRESRNNVRCDGLFVAAKEDHRGWDFVYHMERLTSLKSFLHKQIVTKRDVIRIGLDMCAAIEDCRNIGIIRQDVGVDNIFIDSNGVYKLGDIGIASWKERDLFDVQMLPHDYTAPENLKRNQFSISSTIYSLGIVLYWLLNNGRMPFLKSDGKLTMDQVAEAQHQRLIGNSPPPPEDADKRLAEIVLRACSPDCEERYHSVEEIAYDLQKILPQCDDSVLLLSRNLKRGKATLKNRPHRIGMAGRTQ